MRLRVAFMALVMAGTAFAAEARADIEWDVLVCSGRLSPGTLREQASASFGSWLACTRAGVAEGGLPNAGNWYDGPARSEVWNAPLAPDVARSVGSLEVTVGSQQWAVVWDDIVVEGVMRFANGSYMDLVRPVGSSEPPYHIHAGYLRDIPSCADQPPPAVCSPTGPSTDFHFVAERVYDWPI